MSLTVLSTIQQGITRYGMPMMVAVANMSNSLSILIFARKNQRASSCSIYLVFAAVSSIISINWAIIPIINALYHPPDPFTQSLLLCRLRGYILQVANNLYRTFLTFACIDRYATSHSSIRVRSWATTNVAWKVVPISILIWLLVPTHILVWQTIEKSKCSTFGVYATFYATYLLIVIFTPICLISVFGFLTLRNLQQSCVRVRSWNGPVTVASEQRRKRDSDLRRMVLTEVLVYLILTSAYPIVYFYTTITASITNKSATRLQIESFVSFMTNSCLQYLNSGSCFFIYVATSRTFRNEIKRLVWRSRKNRRSNS